MIIEQSLYTSENKEKNMIHNKFLNKQQNAFF